MKEHETSKKYLNVYVYFKCFWEILDMSKFETRQTFNWNCRHRTCSTSHHLFLRTCTVQIYKVNKVFCSHERTVCVLQYGETTVNEECEVITSVIIK